MDVSEKMLVYMRLKLLEYFESPKMVWGITNTEPFKSDIKKKKYTVLQLRKMLQSLAAAGLLKYPPFAGKTSARVYALTDLGRIALQRLREAETQTVRPSNSSK